DLRHRHPFLCLAGLHDLVAGLHFSFLENAEVESRTSATRQQSRHSRLIQTDAHAITGDAGLGDFKKCVSDPVTVADAHGIVRQSLYREILTKLPEGRFTQVRPFQLFPPVTIGFDLVDEDRPLLASMAGQIALTIALQVQPPGATAAGQRTLPASG